jgi:hypothetical protein
MSLEVREPLLELTPLPNSAPTTDRRAIDGGMSKPGLAWIQRLRHVPAIGSAVALTTLLVCLAIAKGLKHDTGGLAYVALGPHRERVCVRVRECV